MNDICEECVDRLQNTQLLGLSETWAEPDEFVVTLAALQSSASNGCKLCDLHLHELVEKRLPTDTEANKIIPLTDKDLSAEFVISLQLFAHESDELHDVARLIRDGTPYDLYAEKGEFQRLQMCS